MVRRSRLGVVCLTLALMSQLFFTSGNARASGTAWPTEWEADSAFYDVWSRADEPVAAGSAQRSWLWGPAPFAVANEEYSESPTGSRLVEYMDKARMEVNDPSAQRGSPWFVTSGLLVYEMVSGQMQTGNNRFEARPAAALPVAGDASSPGAPTYAAFAQYTGPAASAVGRVVQERIDRDGTVSRLDQTSGLPTGAGLFGLSYYDEVSKHNVPAVFTDWMRQSGKVLENGRLLQAPLFDPLYLLGRPITEPYWADVLVGGSPARVLVQLYERRALTYNPGNAPEWRVEMANVGRAYYDWRYGAAPPVPAIASSVTSSGVSVRGWNWHAGDTVRLEVDLAGADAPLVGPQDAAIEPSGRFSADLPLNAQLQGALIAGANVQVRASDTQAQAALPLSGKVDVGKAHLEGILTQVGADGLQMLTRDGKQVALALSASSKVQYSEGDAALASVTRAGMAVSVDGTQSGNKVAVDTMRLLSVSRTGAKIGFTLQPDGKSIRASGTGWPGENVIGLTLGRLDAPGVALASVRSDSRGNFDALVKLPAASALPQGPLWLSAMAPDKGSLLARVTVPAELTPQPGTGAGAPPQLSVVSAAGEQRGGLGSYCWHGVCADSIGAPVPAAPLPVKQGEVLGLRSQYGPDPEVGLSPTAFSAQLYAYSASAATQGPGDVLYFTPSSQPVHSTGQLPGRPFSVALPSALPRGMYVMLVSVSWPDPSGATGDATYAFLLNAP